MEINQIKIDWSQAPTEDAVWCQAIDEAVSMFEGWHEKREDGSYWPVGDSVFANVPWLANNEGVLFKVYKRRRKNTA